MLTELIGLAMIGAGLTIKSIRSKKSEERKPPLPEETAVNEYQDRDRIVDLEEYRRSKIK